MVFVFVCMNILFQGGERYFSPWNHRLCDHGSSLDRSSVGVDMIEREMSLMVALDLETG